MTSAEMYKITEDILNSGSSIQKPRFWINILGLPLKFDGTLYLAQNQNQTTKEFDYQKIDVNEFKQGKIKFI